MAWHWAASIRRSGYGTSRTKVACACVRGECVRAWRVRACMCRARSCLCACGRALKEAHTPNHTGTVEAGTIHPLQFVVATATIRRCNSHNSSLQQPQFVVATATTRRCNVQRGRARAGHTTSKSRWSPSSATSPPQARHGMALALARCGMALARCGQLGLLPRFRI